MNPKQIPARSWQGLGSLVTASLNENVVLRVTPALTQEPGSRAGRQLMDVLRITEPHVCAEGFKGEWGARWFVGRVPRSLCF